MRTTAIRAARTATAARDVRDFLFMTISFQERRHTSFAGVPGNNGVRAPSFGREGRT
jgi:hypothetical protein